MHYIVNKYNIVIDIHFFFYFRQVFIPNFHGFLKSMERQQERGGAMFLDSILGIRLIGTYKVGNSIKINLEISL